MACNEKCPFCNVPAEDYAQPTPSVDATMAELEDFIATGEKTLTISGGEPTLLRKRLLSVIAAAKSRGIENVELQTNAVLIDEKYADELAKAGLSSAFVSLLSHIAEHHDQLAGLEGAFPKCIRGIDAMLAVGIAVTLNPVVAFQTQALLPDYVRFVTERLPGVTTISLSAVQPHGRAGRDGREDQLLPDYAILGPAVKEARKIAAEHGLTIVNPYCGLPLCIGWDDDMVHSVESVEAEGGGWRMTPGIENTGDKQHGAPCRKCALRPRCGGAWRAYWNLRAGSGLRPPIQLVSPWEGIGSEQSVAMAGTGAASTLAGARTATRWLWTETLVPSDLLLPFTHLAVELPANRLDIPTLKVLKRVDRPVHVGLRVGDDPVDLGAIIGVLQQLGVEHVALLGGVVWEPMAAALRGSFPALGIRRVDRRRRPRAAGSTARIAPVGEASKLR